MTHDHASFGTAYATAALILLFGSSMPAQGATPAFSEQTSAAGLDFVHSPIADIEVGGEMHGGATIADFNGDGWPDIFAVGGGGTADVLYLNNGDGTFTDRAAEWGLTDLYRGNGAAAGDYDKDGDIDLFVTSHGDAGEVPTPGVHRLYRNTGTGFEEVAQQAGVKALGDQPDGFGPAFGDYDLDGDLDLWVSGWWFDAEQQLPRSRLYRNDGDGTFTDVTQTAGVVHSNRNRTGAFGAIFADMNGDRYPELMIANDGGGTQYYANDRDGTFTQVDIFGENKVWHGMGATIADFDRNGHYDWFVTAAYPSMQFLGPPGNRLYLGEGNHQFTELPESGGVNDGGFGWGTAPLDLDHDGWEDIVMTNGWPHVDPVHGEDWRNEPTYLFRNNADLTFTEMGQAIGLDHTGEGRSLGLLDYDHDGDMDLVISTHGGALRLYRNDIAGEDANWLEVLVDTSAHPDVAPDGQGYEIRLSANGETLQRMIAGGASYLGGHELLAHFGMGAHTLAQQVTAIGPDGFLTSLRGVSTNQRLTITVLPPLSASPLVAAQTAELRLDGIAPGQRAHFFTSVQGVGSGPCYPVFGGACLELQGGSYRGSAVADATGEAALEITVGANPQLKELFAQAVVRRGAQGSDSIVSNVLAAPVEQP
ncbi:MAG: CRTAC1 family protein [Pseudomonadota bacterium]